MNHETQKLSNATSDPLVKLLNSKGDLLEHLIAAMAKFHQGSSGNVLTNPYRFVRDKDGCDETFDIYGPGDKRPFISFGFWEAEAEAEAMARRVTAVLNACEGIPTEALEQTLTTAKKLRGQVEPSPTASVHGRKPKPTDRLSVADTSWSDHDLFRQLGLRRFFNVKGKHKVGTLKIDGHRVEIRVHCLPAMFWNFQITGPLFRGAVRTGSGPLVDFWWAVEALIRGTVRITCPNDIQSEANDRAYLVAGNLSAEMMRTLRHLLALGMLVVDPRP